MTAEAWATAGCCWVALVPSGARWLRVAQREHYLAGSASRFALRWLRVPPNAAIVALGVAGVALAWPFPIAGIASALAAAIGPLGLSVRGRTSKLAWTRRLRTLALFWLAVEGAVVAVGAIAGRAAFVSALGVMLCAPAVDVACMLARPLEAWVASRYVASAAARLRAVQPRIVGITGSYGKTSTKNYVAHLLRGDFRVTASPASFNNRAGLARAVNENLTDGTQVFVAEMGTYGRGEIADLCRWCPPDIAVITAIGPVHLERFGSEDAIVRAKSEITEHAAAVVLNVDDRRLAALACQLEQRDQPPIVIRCSTSDPTADICVLRRGAEYDVAVRGEQVAAEVRLGPGVQPTNVACALGVAVHLEVAVDRLSERLADLPVVPHRLTVATAPSGVVVIDDTFNSNPAGARAALGVLDAVEGSGRRVVVTPGMVELGRRQREENTAFAKASLEIAANLVVIGRTNRSALAGRQGSGQVVAVRRREDGVRWVRDHLASGDAVLYENDLPDHYP